MAQGQQLKDQPPKPDYSFESSLHQRGYFSIAGVDEAGRGPLAGPVVAAACILPLDLRIEGIKDSKQLTPLQRYALYEKMLQDTDVCYGVGVVEALRIDQINILQATFEAMLIALDQLRQRRVPDYALVDGSLLPGKLELPAQAVVSGDSLSLSIAAASIIAKEVRDRLMVAFHEKWPKYNFKQHKGYATEEHLEYIQLYGPSPIHRLSFSPFKQGA